MPNAAKKEGTKAGIFADVLSVQARLQKLLVRIKRLADESRGKDKIIPGHWTSVMLEIVGERKQGVMQEISAVQSALRVLPEINYDLELQRTAANLGDEFNSLQELQSLIVTEITLVRRKEELAAVLDEIKRKCTLIMKDIKDIRTSVAKLSESL